MQTTIYLMRHASYANPKGLFPGRDSGYPLSEKGWAEAVTLANFFKDKHVSAVVASPLTRTMQTAEIIADILHLPVGKDDRLLEVRTPELFAGESMAFVDELGAGVYASRYVEQGMEPLEDQYQRMDECIRGLVQKYPGKTVIAVSHGDPIMAVYFRYKGVTDLDKQRFIDETYVPMAGGLRITYAEDGTRTSLARITPTS